MEVKSFTDCLHFIDNMILYNVEKVDSMDGLESMRDFVLDNYIKKSDEELVGIMSILSQINLIINRFYLPDDYSITDYYYDLKRRTSAWLKACNKISMMIINFILSQLSNKFTLLSKTTYSINASSMFKKTCSTS